MAEATEDRASILPLMLLAAVLGWLAISRPGNLGGEFAALQMVATLAAVSAVAYASWRFHGYVAAIVTIVLFRFADPDEPLPQAFQERGVDALLLVTMWIGMVACSRQGRTGNGPWAMLLVLSTAVAFFGFYGFGIPASEDLVARERITHLMIGLSVLAFFTGFLAGTDSWRDRFKLLGVTIVVPALGLLAAKFVRGELPGVWQGGDWSHVFAEWKSALDDGSWKTASWCWSTPWICGSLVVFGLWRTFARGRKQRQLGRAPTAWLLTVASVGSLLAIGARPLATGSMLLAAIGAILSVFGVADFILAVVERIALDPPPPGPSDVPRVK